MDEQRQAIKGTVIRETKFRTVLFHAFILSLICTLFTIPSFHHMLVESMQSDPAPVFKYDYRLVLMMELFMLFFTCFLSSVSGFSLRQKYDLPEIWDYGHLKKWFPVLILTGIGMGGMTFFLFDRHFYFISPESYPSSPLYVISRPFKLAFTNEVILRFGLVTILVGLFKNKIVAVTLVSLFASFLTMKYFRFMGIDYPYNDFFQIQFFISFTANFLLGLCYIKLGLFYSMALHFLFGWRLLFVVLILG